MDRVVVVAKRLLETFHPDSIEFTETFTNKPVEGGVRPFLRTTLDDHVYEFNLENEAVGWRSDPEIDNPPTYLFALLELDFEQFMDRFLVVQGIHDSEVDRSSQIHQVGLGAILDIHFFFNGW